MLLVMANKQDLPNAMSTQEPHGATVPGQLRSWAAAGRNGISLPGAGAKAGPQQPGEISEEMARAGRLRDAREWG